MGRRAARALHLALSMIGVVLYFLFVIPRWWVLIGDIPATLATAGRIAAGIPIAAAAVPVALSLKNSLRPASPIPELALRLRAWSAVLHVVAGALIAVTAVVEIWLSLDSAGPWLFGVYGAAGAIAVLAVAAFALSFTAEKPPKPPKPVAVAVTVTEEADGKAGKPPKKRRTRKRGGAVEPEPAADEAARPEADHDPAPDAAEGSAPDVGEDQAPDVDGDPTPEAGGDPASSDDRDADSEPSGNDSAEPATGTLRNKRPTGKRRHRPPR